MWLSKVSKGSKASTQGASSNGSWLGFQVTASAESPRSHVQILHGLMLIQLIPFQHHNCLTWADGGWWRLMHTHWVDWAPSTLLHRLYKLVGRDMKSVGILWHSMAFSDLIWRPRSFAGTNSRKMKCKLMHVPISVSKYPYLYLHLHLYRYLFIYIYILYLYSIPIYLYTGHIWPYDKSVSRR